MGWNIRAIPALLAIGLLPFATLSGCDSGRTPESLARDAAPPAEFVEAQAAWRRARAEALTAPDGWAGLVGLHWIGPGPHYVGSGAGNGVRLAVGPSELGMVDVRGDGIRLVPEPGVALTLDGEPLNGTARLGLDSATGGPTVVGFDAGKGRLVVIRRGKRHAIRVWHEAALARTAFRGIEYWPGGPDWVVAGQYTRHPERRLVQVADIVGTIEQVANPGVIEFEHDGRTHRIEVLAPGPEGGAIAFVDATSGHGSYGIGRYLDVDLPAAEGPVRLDFNRAYNPPCAFSAYSTCRLTPDANRLDLRIEAGEKAYVAPPTP
ncbi:DUF1684 domain-containing protein [Lysobacter sp. A3-1-A15]|uniref:DUF1684 domain-containing protein n=1 Tax=Novilysobacter viscosus TaxID=3098602 RepID=UPI002EDB4B55